MKKTFTRILRGMKSMIFISAFLATGTLASMADDGPSYTASPEPGVVKTLSEIYVTWGSSKLIKNTGDITLQINNGEPLTIDADVYLGSDPMGGFIPATPGNIRLLFDPAYTAPGKYTITIPEGYVTVVNADVPNGEIVLNYEIEGEIENPGGGEIGEVPTPTVDPAPNSTVESISTLTLDWGIEIEEGSLGSGWFSSVNVYKDGEYYSYPEEEQISGNKAILYFEPAITAPGEYEIEIPEYYVNFPTLGEDVTNPTYKFKYNIEGGSDNPSVGVKPISIDPEDGSSIAVLDKITLNWDYRYINNGSGKATITKEGGETIDITEMITNTNGSYISNANSTIRLNPAINEEGQYTVFIPAGFFNLSNSYYGGMESSAEIELIYTVTGGEIVVPVPSYTVTPENESILNKLDKVEVKWGSSMLSMGTGEVTLQINDSEPFAIDTRFSPGTAPQFGGIVPGVPGSVSMSFNPAYTAPGTYVITIPAGYVNVTDASAPNGEIVLTYTIEESDFEEPTPTIDPENNSEVDRLSEITISWGTAIEEGNNMESYQSTVEIFKDEEPYDAYVYGYIENNDLVLYFYEDITEAGEYDIIIPEDYVIFTVADQSNSELKLHYTIKGSGDEPTPTEGIEPLSITPEDGSELEEISEIEIVWSQKIVNEAQGEVTLTYNGQTLDITENVSSLGSFSGNATTTIKFDEPFTEPGEYVITIPAGFVTLSDALVGAGDPNAEIVIKYTIPAPLYTVIPESSLTPMEKLPEEVRIYFGDRSESLGFTGNGIVTLRIDDRDEIDITDNVTIESDEIGEGWDFEILYYAAIDCSTFKIDKGNFIITIPEGFFNIGGISIGGSFHGGTESPEIYVLYVIDSALGINGIYSDSNGRYMVYNMNGVLIMSTENVLDLNGLEAGLYIINGKKVIIKK